MRTWTWIMAAAVVALIAPGGWARTMDSKPKAAAATQPSKQAADGATTKPAAESKLVGWLEISDQLHEGGAKFAWMSEKDQEMSLPRAVRLISDVADNPRLSGLVIDLDEPDLRLSQVDALAAAIRRVRASGKTVMVFAEAYDLPTYLLACEADKVLLQHKGEMELAGLGMEEMYFAGLLEKVGAKADFLQVGKYKGADEPITRTGPSPEWSHNIDGVLDDLYSQVLDRISQRRHLSREKVEKLMADCWTLDDKGYVDAGAVDALTGPDLAEATESVWGDDFDWKDLNEASENTSQPDNPLAMLAMLFQQKHSRINRPAIAVIHAEGEIDSGESNASSPHAGPFDEPSIGSKTMQDMLGECRDNELIKGVVIRIDSPGGSALASEIIWQAIREVAEDKPVYVSVGGMAASGGYYMSSAAKAIYVEPSSIVGSIGVVGGKIVMGDLYNKIGVAVTRRHRGPNGDMFNSIEPFTPEQRAALTVAFEKTYQQFIERVTSGRGKKIADVGAVAEGRLFTGRQAVANGLADKIGGQAEAVHDLAVEAGLKPGSYDLVQMPPPLTFSDFIQHALGQIRAPVSSAAVDSQMLAALEAVAGPALWRQAGPTVRGLLLLRREPVLTLMPEAILVK